MKNLKKWYINLSIQRKILYCTLGVALVVLLAASVCDRTDKEAVCGSGERVVGEFGSLF